MLRIVLAALAAVAAGVIYFIDLVYKKRREMDGLPCPPMTRRLLGHLEIVGDCRRLFPPEVHIHNWWRYVQKKYDQGDCFYIDMWPLGPRFFFTSNPELANQFIVTNSLPKSPLEVDFLNVFLGDNNLVTVEGQQWKTLRSMFNPGFSAGHLMTLVPYIVDASTVFYEVIVEKAKTNELFEMEEVATRLTIDIIGKVVLDSDFNSQKQNHPIVDTFRARAPLMPMASPVMDMSRFEFVRRYKLWRNGQELDRLIGEELDRKMANHANGGNEKKAFKDRKRSVIDLAMDAYAKEQAETRSTKTGANQPMNKTFRQSAIDSMKTFLFAGHDTTSSTIAYVFYLLHFYPKVHEKVVAEIDEVFGKGATTATMAATIKTQPHIINRLEYITAVVKEVLRLFPPASTLRYVPGSSDPNKDAFLTHPETGQKLPISGVHLWPIVVLMSRNETFFPEPLQFIPERFIQSQTPFPDAKLFTPAGKDAWRPFEKGPRNCIGQELAMIESKVIVAMTVKEFDFVAEFNGKKCEEVTPIETYLEYADGRPGVERMTIEGHSAFQILLGSAKPRDGMPGRLSFRKS